MIGVRSASVLWAAHALVSIAVAAAPTHTVTKGVAYLESAGSPAADVYRPTGADSTHRKPGFVWIHGGGWSGGSRDGGREVAVCSTLARAGYVTISISYQLSDSAKPSWPVNLQQCKAAIRFLRRYAARYGVDTANVFVGGGSAGAHLAAMAGLTAPDQFRSADHKGWSDRVNGVLDMYGPVSTYEWWNTSSRQLLGTDSRTDPLVAQSSVETYIRKDSPPVFIAHGLADGTVDTSLSTHFDKRLAAAGAGHVLVLIPGAAHSFTLEQTGGKPLSVDLKTQVLDWLHSRLRTPTALGPRPSAIARRVTGKLRDAMGREARASRTGRSAQSANRCFR
jgi:acetyl esterase/lipase